MARNAGDVLVKRNSKLESFLKKNLDEDTFQKIRCHEASIVCSDTEDKAYKFVVLTDDWIYLTENPPKKVHPVVHLGDVLSVDLVNEFPDFLSGEERDCCQHVRIKYLTKPTKGKKKDKDDKAQNGDVTARNGSVTARSARQGSVSARSGLMSARNTQLARGKTSSMKERGTARIPQDRHLSLDASVLRDALHETDDSQSPRSPKLKKGKKTRKKRKDSDSQSVTSNLATTLRNRYSSSEYDRVRERIRPLPNPADEWDENGDLTDKRRKEPLRLSYSEKGELHLSLDQLDDEGSECSGKENDDVFNETSATNGTTKSDTTKKKGVKTGLFSGLRSKSKDTGSKQKDDRSSTSTPKIDEEEDVEGEAKEEELRRTTLHLYILNYSSPVLMLTRTAWNNYLIRGTLLLDEDYEKKTLSLFSPRTTRGAAVSKYEKLDILFTQLTTELMNAENTMEDTFALLHELKVATERNNALKAMFWKKTDVFLFLVRQIQLYLPSPKITLNANYETAKAERADQMDFVNLVLEIMALMLRETEVLPSRLQCLKLLENRVTGKGKSMLDMIVMMTSTPWLPQKPGEDVKKSANNNNLISSSYVELWTSLTDIDLKQLLEELTDHSTTVLYELVLIAHQANWGDTNGSFLNICWLMKVLDELNSTESFVARLVNQTLRHILPTARREELTPDEAVLVFMQFSVLQTMVEYSPQMAAFIRNNFYEEFKYYIQAPIILQKLPPYYPIAPYTIRLMEEVMTSILEKKVSLRLDQHYDQLF